MYTGNQHTPSNKEEIKHNKVITRLRYWLDGPGIESRWGEIFRTHPVQPWRPPSNL
jgi:hypothetical protein